MADSCRGASDSSAGSSTGENCRGDACQQVVAYVFVKLLGRGAFGDANLYHKVEDNVLVVWKEIDLRKMNENSRQGALNEIKILSILNHPNIISYLNHFSDASTLYIEMEYANGGTLYEKVNGMRENLPEPHVLWYLYQLVCAVEYVHDCSILHRDIKTLNIFLNKHDHLKLGDFGISKMFESDVWKVASTYVGTPYYMSPEIVKGELYDQKSDIWAVGCALYEMMTSCRAFEATNPLKLASDIIHCDMPSISGKCSDDLVQLVSSLLNKDKHLRPSASEIRILPLLERSAESWKSKFLESSSVDIRQITRFQGDPPSNLVTPTVTSKTCELFCWGGGRYIPQKMETFSREKSPLQVSIGHSHTALVTMEKELYTWSNVVGQSSTRGQLGHGDRATYKMPKRVEFEEVEAIRRVSCGDDFTLCTTDDGLLYFFGSNEFGCSGLEGEVDDVIVAPVPVLLLADRPVEMISCGSNHVLVITQSGEIYSWGCGECGCLGLGDENNRSTPQKVSLPCRPQLRAVGVHAGSDRSIVLTKGGQVFACGSNEYNKLGFDQCTMGVSLKGRTNRRKEAMQEVQQSLKFELVRSLKKYRIVDASTGLQHTVFLDWHGRLITVGDNGCGQLGLGDLKPRQGVNLVGGTLAGQKVNRVSCGDWFTVASTEGNIVYSWGLGDSGRLGNALVESSSSSSSSSSTSSSHPARQKLVTSFPRTVFGSLHEVSDVSCRHWNAAIIAGRVIAQKTVASFSLSPSGFESVVQSDCSSASNSSSQQTNLLPSTSSFAKDTVPDWLKAEMDFAKELEESESHVGRCGDDYEVVEPRVSEGSLCRKEVESPRRREARLATDNFELKLKIAEQSEEIERLNGIIRSLTSDQR